MAVDQPKKILIIQTAFIGDVVLATALIEKLHAFYSSAQIDFLLRKGNEALLDRHPFLHAVLIWNKKEQKRMNLFRMLKRIRKEKYDVVVNVQRFAATGLLTAFSGAKKKIGFNKNPFSMFFTQRVTHLVSEGDQALHEIERNQVLITSLTDDKAALPKLYPSQKDFETVQVYKSGRYITVSPASVWFTKQYPKEKWISFIQKLPAEFTVYLLGAPGDLALCKEIADASADKCVKILCGKLSFLQSAALMRDAQMNFVNDSAPMHFASAMNAPVTAVYCSTIPAFGFGPLSSNRHIVEVQEKLPCRPCGLHGRKACPLGHFKCAMNIKDGQLLELVQSD